METAAEVERIRVTQSELARDRGVSRQAIHDLVQRGILRLEEDGKLDLQAARVRLAALHPGAKTAGREASGDYHAARVRREEADARMAEHKGRELRAQLVGHAEVRAAFEAKVRELSGQLLQIPARCAEALARDNVPQSIYPLLDGELRAALQFVSSTASAPVETIASDDDSEDEPFMVLTGDPADDYHAWRARREVAEAELSELRLQELQGDLVRKSDELARLGGKVAALREGVLQIPARVTPVLAAESNPEAIRALLDAELRTALAFVSQPTTNDRGNHGSE